MKEKIKYSMTFGLIIFAIVGPLTYLELATSWGMGGLSNIALIGGLVFALFKYKKSKENFSYKDNLSLGLLLGMFLGVWIGVLNYILMNIVDPSLIDKLIVENEKVIRQGMEFMKMDPLQIDEKLVQSRIESRESLTSPLSQVQVNVLAVGTLYFLFSLIIGIFNRKKSEEASSLID